MKNKMLIFLLGIGTAFFFQEVQQFYAFENIDY